MTPAATAPPAVHSKDLSIPKTVHVPPKGMEEKLSPKRKIICFSGPFPPLPLIPPISSFHSPNVDFDGTIFLQDTGHILFDAHGCGPSHRTALERQINSGERSFRDVSEEMWGSLHVPFEDGFAVMAEKLEIDPDFRSFHAFCLANEIPFHVISAGLQPVLRRVLDAFLGEEQSGRIEIVANEAEIRDGAWKPVWRHYTELGHDKARSIQEYTDRARRASDDGTAPLVVFMGDGVSDLPAAREADVLFARRGLRLEEYCVEHGIAYLPFDTFADIQREVRKMVTGVPVRFTPRADLWRRVRVPLYRAAAPNTEKMFLWPSSFSEYKPRTVAA